MDLPTEDYQQLLSKIAQLLNIDVGLGIQLCKGQDIDIESVIDIILKDIDTYTPYEDYQLLCMTVFITDDKAIYPLDHLFIQNHPRVRSFKIDKNKYPIAEFKQILLTNFNRLLNEQD